MKSLIRTLILALFTLGVVCQVSAQKNRIWWGNDFSICKKGKATHYIEIAPKGQYFTVSMYDLTNRLRMKGSCLDPKGEVLHGQFEFYYTDGNLESTGSYLNDAKVGVWERFDAGGNRLAERTYAAFDTNRMAYVYVDEMPVYEGGSKNFQTFLKQKISHLVNENEFADNGLDLELGFVVQKNGQIEGVEFIKGHSPEWDIAALEELKALPSWIPGKKSGDEVPVFVCLPIRLSR